MHYFFADIPGSTHIAWVRKTVADKLIKAAKNLPTGCRLKILDAWRSLETQKVLYDKFIFDLKLEYPWMDDAEICVRAQEFVSYPSKNGFLHATGGSIDVTLSDEDGNERNMGSKFDEFTDRSHTDYYETHVNSQIINNRNILYEAMTKVGFVNLPSEWWHYSYGDALWSIETNNPVKYKSVINYSDLSNV
jgi:D-alanyl-D-alanine dipeptidase